MLQSIAGIARTAWFGGAATVNLQSGCCRDLHVVDNRIVIYPWCDNAYRTVKSKYRARTSTSTGNPVMRVQVPYKFGKLVIVSKLVQASKNGGKEA